MTKETQTQAIAEPFKFKNAALLNRLSEMAQVPYYATACHTLIQAEMAIVELERENATLRTEVERLAAQSAPLQQAAREYPSQKYDDVLLPFLTLMRKELHANSGKGDRPGWLAMDANTALLEVYWHTAKLSAAVKNNDGPAIMEHSADVANMAMMVLDVCGGLVQVDADRAAAQVEPVRMLTQPELNDVALSEKVGWGPGEYVEAVQRAFCRINAGKRIPADGEVR